MNTNKAYYENTEKVLFALFISGIFFGGGLDQAIYAISKSGTSHCCFNISAGGNWFMFLFDSSITGMLLYFSFRSNSPTLMHQ